MHKWGVAALAGGVVVLGSLAPAASAISGRSAHSANSVRAADIGSYLTPFREDGATFVGDAFASGTYRGQPTDNNGCLDGPTTNSPAGNPMAYRCMPAGASVVQLYDGRILYWDALEGTENFNLLGGSTILFDGGKLTVNDESRLMSLTASGASWATPANADGGAKNAAGTSEDLPLPPPLGAVHYTYNSAGMFCSDQVFLSNGSVLDVGGTDYYPEPSVPLLDKGLIELEGVRNSRIFDPTVGPVDPNSGLHQGGWMQAASMNYGRWYPSLVTLGSGNVFVASGVTKLIKPFYPTHLLDSLANVRQTETYSPTQNVWSYNGAAGNRSLPLFPRIHLLPDGHVFYDAAGQAFNPMGQAIDEALWNIAGSYDPASKSWHDLGIPGLLSPGVNPLYMGFRGSTFDAALQLRPDASGNYSKASFLTAGGVLLPTPGSVLPVADSRINTVSMNGAGGESLSTISTGPLTRPRWYSAAVPLPDGTIYAVNGADMDEVIAPGMESPITQAELFTPTVDGSGSYTGGSWQAAGTEARKRTYHNTAILLPDGRVLIGGNAPIPFLYTSVIDGISLPGRPGTNNHHDASFQIYEPPYYHQSRPTLGAVAQSGHTLVVHTPDAATIASVVVIRNTAQTHIVDGDARTVQLPVVSRAADSVTVELPESSNVLPAGPYLLFANQNKADVNDAAPGHVVPSIGQQIFVTGTSAPAVLAPAARVVPRVAGFQASVRPAASTGKSTSSGVAASGVPAAAAPRSAAGGAATAAGGVSSAAAPAAGASASAVGVSAGAARSAAVGARPAAPAAAAAGVASTGSSSRSARSSPLAAGLVAGSAATAPSDVSVAHAAAVSTSRRLLGGRHGRALELSAAAAVLAVALLAGNAWHRRARIHT